MEERVEFTKIDNYLKVETFDIIDGEKKHKLSIEMIKINKIVSATIDNGFVVIETNLRTFKFGKFNQEFRFDDFDDFEDLMIGKNE